MTDKIRALRKLADEAYTTASESREIAEQARADYRRLLAENRERFAAKGKTELAADMAFARYTVTRDCIDTEQMHGRWAQEGVLVANAHYAQVAQLMEDLLQFMRERRPSPVPRPRSES